MVGWVSTGNDYNNNNALPTNLSIHYDDPLHAQTHRQRVSVCFVLLGKIATKMKVKVKARKRERERELTRYCHNLGILLCDMSLYKDIHLETCLLFFLITIIWNQSTT